MQLNVRPLLGGEPGQDRLEFSFEADLSGRRLWGGTPFTEPVSVKGVAEVKTEGLYLRYTAEYTLEAECARCLAPVRARRADSFTHLVLGREEGDEEAEAEGCLYAVGGLIDGAQLAAADLLLALDSVLLCGPDCKGLCPKCGKDLNRGGCGCDLREPDPRFDVLRKLMES